MKKRFSSFISSLVFLGKISFLLVLIAAGWGISVVTGMFKSRDMDEDEKDLRKLLQNSLFRAPDAKADEPHGGKGQSTPFLAVFDGNKYKLENDILFGRPKSYHPSFEVAQFLYRDGRISPDMYKITAPIRPHQDKLLFQIQEIELEESYFKWLDLKRIVHPVGTEVVVDSEYKKYYILDREKFRKNISLPSSVKTENGRARKEELGGKESIWNDPKTGIKFEHEESIELVFKGFEQNKTPYLVVKSWFRDWVLGLEEEWTPVKHRFMPQLLNSHTARSTFTVLAALVGLFFWRRGVYFEPSFILPLIGGCSCGCGAASCNDCPCSFVYKYQDALGQYHRVGVSEPRAWHWNTEIIEFPGEAVLADGTLKVKITSSKKHTLGFVGAVQNLENSTMGALQEEKLGLAKAFHSRLNHDFAPVLQQEEGEYVQTLPGDKIDLEFEASKRPPGSGQKETYLMRASGFYTALRAENRIKIGNWQEKISEEARQRLASLTPLSKYHDNV